MEYGQVSQGSQPALPQPQSFGTGLISSQSYPNPYQQAHPQSGTPSMPSPAGPSTMPPNAIAGPSTHSNIAGGSTPAQPPAKKRKIKASAAIPPVAQPVASAPLSNPPIALPMTAVPAGYVMPPPPPGPPIYDPPSAVAGPSTIPSSSASVVKRPRGRPRKLPLPAVPPQPAPAAASSSVPHSLPQPSTQGLPAHRPSPTHFPSPASTSSHNLPLPPLTTLKDYVTRLNAHIESTQTRAEGNAEAYLPTGEWSAADKASFYPILSRHSTLRPDLIAHDTGKSQGQVQQYIGTLQSQVSAEPIMRSSGLKGEDEWSKGIAPAAREIPEGDIREEEAVAAVLLSVEEKAAELPKKKRGKKKMDEATWGSQLDGAKLSTLSALVHSTIPNDPLAGNKAAKLLRDEQSLAALLAVPVDQRSLSQQKEIRRLKDRKTMRMKYRHNKLLSEGMTAEQIEQRGGPDAIYLARAGPPVAETAPAAVATALSEDPLKGNKHAKIMRDDASLTSLLALKAPNRDEVAEIRRLTNKKRARQRIRKRKLLEEGMTEEELAAIDIDELFAQRAGIPWGDEGPEQESEILPALGEWVSGKGFDLWNYDLMIRGLGDVQISFDILDQLRTYLLAFLVPLVHKVINLAEREGTEPTSSHVRLLLEAALRIPDPAEMEGDEWEIETTTTDKEDEELDNLLDEVDAAYDEVRQAIGGDWDDPFHAEKIRRGGSDEAKAKRKEYLRLLRCYNRRRARRAMKRERGDVGRSKDEIRVSSESLIGTTDEEDEGMEMGGDEVDDDEEGEGNDDESDLGSQDGIVEGDEDESEDDCM